jgi:hypothetical protein
MPAALEHIIDKLPHFCIVINDENCAPIFCHAAPLLYQDAEKVLQLRSRLLEILNVPQGYASGFESPAALLENFLSILGGYVLLSQTFKLFDLLWAGIIVLPSAGDQPSEASPLLETWSRLFWREKPQTPPLLGEERLTIRSIIESSAKLHHGSAKVGPL